MRPAKTLICPALALLTVACMRLEARTQSSSPSSAEQEVTALEEKWLQNEDKPEVVETILADDFVHVLSAGFITKSQQLAYLKQHPNAFPGSKHFEDLRVRIYGDIAIANGIFTTVLDAQASPKRTIFTDVFVRRAGKWLAVNAQELPLPESVTSTTNGR